MDSWNSSHNNGQASLVITTLSLTQVHNYISKK